MFNLITNTRIIVDEPYLQKDAKCWKEYVELCFPNQKERWPEAEALIESTIPLGLQIKPNCLLKYSLLTMHRWTARIEDYLLNHDDASPCCTIRYAAKVMKSRSLTLECKLLRYLESIVHDEHKLTETLKLILMEYIRFMPNYSWPEIEEFIALCPVPSYNYIFKNGKARFPAFERNFPSFHPQHVGCMLAYMRRMKTPLPELESIIFQKMEQLIILYSLSIDRSLPPLAKTTAFAGLFSYCKQLKKAPWKQLEDLTIMALESLSHNQQFAASLFQLVIEYCHNITKKRWLEVEPYIQSNNRSWDAYSKVFIDKVLITSLVLRKFKSLSLDEKLLRLNKYKDCIGDLLLSALTEDEISQVMSTDADVARF